MVKGRGREMERDRQKERENTSESGKDLVLMHVWPFFQIENGKLSLLESESKVGITENKKYNKYQNVYFCGLLFEFWSEFPEFVSWLCVQRSYILKQKTKRNGS